MTMKRLVRELVDSGVLKTPSVVEAFRRTDRADFVLPAERSFAYANEPLSIGYGQTISQPYTVAFMLELLAPKTGDKILDVGSGSGWTAALLSYIVSHDGFGKEVPHEQEGRVVGLEIVPELAAFGRKNVYKYNYITRGIAEIHCLNAGKGYSKEAPYERIIAAAAGSSAPPSWREQLKVGGVIVAPFASRIMKLTKKEDGTFTEESFEGFAFVPFVSENEGA